MHDLVTIDKNNSLFQPSFLYGTCEKGCKVLEHDLFSKASELHIICAVMCYISSTQRHCCLTLRTSTGLLISP